MMLPRLSTALWAALVLLSLAPSARAQSITQLTRNGARMDDYCPVLSRDGEVFAWIGPDPVTSISQVWAADARYLTPRMLTNGSAVMGTGALAISGDGSTIAYVQNGDLWTVSPFGGAPRRVTTVPSHLSLSIFWGIALTDDGGLAVGTVYDVNTKVNDVYSIRTDTGATANLTKLTTLANVAATVSGDGKRVLYTSNRGGTHQMWTCRIDGTGHKELTNLSDVGPPRIDRRGELCAFTACSFRNLRVHLVRTDGTGLFAVSPDEPGANHNLCDLSGDGDRVTWISESRSLGDAYLAFPDGSGLRRLTTGDAMRIGQYTTSFRLDDDGTTALFATCRDLGGGNPEGDSEIFLWRDGLAAQGIAVPGGSVVLNLNDPTRPGAAYLVRCALGRSPGMSVLGTFIPLNYDALFLLSGLAPSIFARFDGTLDAGGKGGAGIHIPPDPALVGFGFYASFVTVDAAKTLASYNPVKIRIQ